MKTLKIYQLLKQSLQAVLVAACLAGTVASSHAQSGPPAICGDTNTVKFYLPPQANQGLDVKDSRDQIVLADDFACTQTGPVSGIHVWGSWLNDQPGTITNFFIGIYSDVPAVTSPASGLTISNSHPGILLWSNNFGAGQFTFGIYTNGSEYFYNPTNNLIAGTDSQVWYYCFFPTNPFVQQGTAAAPTNYWLAIRAQVADSNTNIIYGWKSSTIPYGDPAVWGTFAGGLPNGDWQSITNPTTQPPQPMNLSMLLTTSNAPTQPPCVEANGVKYDQEPNLNGGYDVWNSFPIPAQVTDGPWVVADDFVCNQSGQITDLHLWGSWLNNLAFTNTITFTLGIYDNVATNAANPYSHPGNLLWSQTFTPGQYTETFYGTGTESFLDPGPPRSLGPENYVYYYCFNPTNLFQQQGHTYWLAAFAQVPAGTPAAFGWKTTFVVSNDISVHSVWPGTLPPSGSSWAPTFSPQGQPLDLAFRITTPTNPCQVSIICSTNKTVPCGTTWSFNPPVVSDSCCSLLTITTNIVTNSTTTCSQSITATFNVFDCSNVFLGSCVQTVTVLDTNPPIITCHPGKLVTNGTAWTFDPPTATDPCSGDTNITITVISTVTNAPNGPCNETITRTWEAMNACSNSAFCSQTVTNVCVPVVCVESDYEKYTQGPKTIGGFDVWNQPYVLADDFVCTNTGPISDIHLWGSWLHDYALPNSITFWLGIYDDVPAVTNVDGKVVAASHPGTNLLWQQWFVPGQYAETIWTANASENFLDPGRTNVLGTDSVVWYYCFYPTNAFEQLGTATNSKTYWLAAYAQLSATNLYGWKTTTNVLNDVSVHAFWPGFAPTNNPGWTPTVYQPPTGGPVVPLDLAFKLTSCGPVHIAFITPTNVVVTWQGDGYLQSATNNVLGPYYDVPGNPPSPFTDYSVSPTNKFYRLRCY